MWKKILLAFMLVLGMVGFAQGLEIDYRPSPVTCVEHALLDSLNVDKHIRVVGYITCDSLDVNTIVVDSLLVITIEVSNKVKTDSIAAYSDTRITVIDTMVFQKGGLFEDNVTLELTAGGGISVYVVDADSLDDAVISLYHAGGTIASPTATGNAWQLGSYEFGGYGAGWTLGAEIRAFSIDTWSASENPAKIEFLTTADDSTSGQVRVTIKDDGDVEIANNLIVTKDVTADSVHANHYGGTSDFSIGSSGEDVTVNADTLKGAPVWSGLLDCDNTVTGVTLTDGAFSVTSGAVTGVTTLSMNNQLTNTLADGTAPMVITSTTKVVNLNVEEVDGLSAAATATASQLLALDADKDLELGTGDVNCTDVGATGNVAGATIGNITEANLLDKTAVEAVSGRYTFSDLTTFSDTVSTQIIQIAICLTEAQNSGVALTAGDFGKTITVNAADAQTVSLPSVAATDVGAWFTVIKLGAGQVTIDAADSDVIADSGAGDTIYNNIATETYATITLRLASETQWAIIGAHGTWTTTD